MANHTLRVLLVDDDVAILEMMEAMMESEGALVDTATSATEAIERLQDTHYDMVVTDMRMEHRLAGFEVVGAAGACTPRPWIAILTAYPIAPGEWKGSGADALYVKGEDIRGMMISLRAHLQRMIA